MGKKNKKSKEDKAEKQNQDDKDKKSNTREMKFAPQDTSNKHKYHTFATIRDHIALKVQKEYEEGKLVSNALKNGVHHDFTKEEPMEKVSTRKDPDARQAEQRRFNHQYDVKFEIWEKSQKQYMDNCDNVCGLIFDDYCTKEMRARLIEDLKWEDDVSQDPLKILNAIRSGTHAPIRSQYRSVLLVDSILNWFGIKQSANEDLIDYFKQGKQLEDVWRSQMGRKCLEFFISEDDGYKAAMAIGDRDEVKRLVDEIYDEVAAYVMIRGADKNKYDSFKTFLTQQYSLGIDQYPKKVQAVLDALGQRKFDQKHYDVQKQKADKAKKQSTAKKKGDGGNSDSKTEAATSFKQGKAGKDLFCYCCGKPGHSSNKCPDKSKIAPNDWVIRKAAIAHMQQQQSKGQGQDAKSESNEKTSWSWFQCPATNDEFSGQQGRFDFLGDTIIIDTGSTINATIMNPKFVKNIRKSDSPILMSTNAGTKRLDLDADMGGLGTVKYDPDQKANIFGFSHLSDKYRITCDTEKDDAIALSQFMVEERINYVKEISVLPRSFDFWNICRAVRFGQTLTNDL